MNWLPSPLYPQIMVHLSYSDLIDLISIDKIGIICDENNFWRHYLDHNYLFNFETEHCLILKAEKANWILEKMAYKNIVMSLDNFHTAINSMMKEYIEARLDMSTGGFITLTNPNDLGLWPFNARSNYPEIKQWIDNHVFKSMSYINGQGQIKQINWDIDIAQTIYKEVDILPHYLLVKIYNYVKNLERSIFKDNYPK